MHDDGRDSDTTAAFMTPERLIALVYSDSKDEDNPQLASSASFLMEELGQLAGKAMADLAMSIDMNKTGHALPSLS